MVKLLVHYVLKENIETWKLLCVVAQKDIMKKQAKLIVNNATEPAKPALLPKLAIVVLRNKIDFIIKLVKHVNVERVSENPMYKMIMYVKNVYYIKENVLMSVQKIQYMMLQRLNVQIEKYQFIVVKK